MRIEASISEKSTHAVPSSIANFCQQSDPYLDNVTTQPSFEAAMQAIVKWHEQRSPWYRAFLDSHGISAGSLLTLDDFIHMPAIHANFFKLHEVLSVANDDIVLHLTSSGTTGQKSQIFFDAFTIENARRMVDDVMRVRGVASSQPANYLVNAYQPLEGMRVGTSNTNQYLMRYAPSAKVFWSLRPVSETAHEFDAFGVLSALQSYATDTLPTRIIGFPAFLHFALQRMKALGLPPLKLPEGSWVIFGGGWKGYADQSISRMQMIENIRYWLGIPASHIVETFGSVEHSIPYISCAHHHLHQPVWSRVVIRDVATLEPLPYGEAGFLSFLSPYITSVPAHSVIMGDMAVLHPEGSCPCGLSTSWFEVLGRAGTSSNKSCAAAAAEMLPLT